MGCCGLCGIGIGAKTAKILRCLGLVDRALTVTSCVLLLSLDQAMSLLHRHGTSCRKHLSLMHDPETDSLLSEANVNRWRRALLRTFPSIPNVCALDSHAASCLPACLPALLPTSRSSSTTSKGQPRRGELKANRLYGTYRHGAAMSSMDSNQVT